ncbi:unnamed protein product, partial [Aureobasidium pullulans]
AISISSQCRAPVQLIAARDGLGAPKNSQQHRRANSTPACSDDFHDGFVKRLVGILDNHEKFIKNNADFLSEISSTLRSHTYSPTAEPALKVPSTPIVQPATPEDSALESSPEFMPPTPPDTPTVEISDWSFMPPKPSEVKHQYEQPKVPKIVIKDHSSSTMTTISAPVSAIMDLSISSNHDTNTVTTSSPAVEKLNTQTTSMVPINRNSVGLSNTASSPFRNMSVIHTTPAMATTDSSSAKLVNQPTASEEDIGNDYYTRKEKEIRDAIKEAFESLRSTLTFYRKHRVAPLELVNAKADVAMPGYWSLDAYGKRRALFHFYNRNKDISKPGDRAHYHDAMALLDACTAMSLNQDFVDKIDRWESQISAMKSESGPDTVIP